MTTDPGIPEPPRFVVDPTPEGVRATIRLRAASWSRLYWASGWWDGPLVWSTARGSGSPMTPSSRAS